ncbi:hypothetical protein F5Y18DRAFT_443537 [Xylariaceae sp. FL1019]|nr:hypothetical protein F5Y18DRAFT_443537 [Xylariaceae sp. FL1019]
MASVSYGVIATSEPFTILVGPDRKVFMMHKELLAAMSKPLNALVAGGMKESRERCAEWPEMDEETFIRFCEFAYTGDYKVAKPKVIDKRERTDVDNAKNKPHDRNHCIATYVPEPLSCSNTKQQPELPTKKDRLTLEFVNRKYQVPEAGHKDQEEIESAIDKDDLSYRDELLSIARLYVVGDYYDIERLRILSLQKLHTSLGAFNYLVDVDIEDLSALADYTYENTIRNLTNKDGLRDLVSTFIACNAEAMWANPHFQAALECVEFSRDIIERLLSKGE